MGLLDFMRKQTSDIDKQVKDSVPAETVIPRTNITEPPTWLTSTKIPSNPKDWIRFAKSRNQRTHEEKVKALKAKKTRKAQKAARKRNRR